MAVTGSLQVVNWLNKAEAGECFLCLCSGVDSMNAWIVTSHLKMKDEAMTDTWKTHLTAVLEKAATPGAMFRTLEADTPVARQQALHALIGRENIMSTPPPSKKTRVE